jgi:integrase
VTQTVREFIENEYLVQKTGVWRASTAVSTENLVRLHILEPLGHRRIGDITRRDLQALLHEKAAAGYSYSIVAHIRWQLRAIFKMAKGDALIVTEPAESLNVPIEKSTETKRVIGPEQILKGQLALEMRERLVFRLAVCEGMRPSEIVGLQIGDLDRDGIHIVRRIYRFRVGPPKSFKSGRLIPPTPITKALLDRWIELIGGAPADAWLFASAKRTTPICYSNLYRRKIKPALDAAGLTGVNYQILRRSWVTEFSEVEDDAYIRATLAGHSVDVNQNEYRQDKIKALRRSMDKLGEHLQ